MMEIRCYLPAGGRAQFVLNPVLEILETTSDEIGDTAE